MISKTQTGLIVLASVIITTVAMLSPLLVCNWMNVGFFNPYGKAAVAIYSGYFPGDARGDRQMAVLIDDYMVNNQGDSYNTDAPDADVYHFLFNFRTDNLNITWVCLPNQPCSGNAYLH